MKHDTTTRPPVRDVSYDITDIWQERTDPENIGDEICTAYLRRDDVGYRAGEDNPLTLTGFSVEDADGTQYDDRARAIRLFGADTIRDIEDAALEKEMGL